MIQNGRNAKEVMEEWTSRIEDGEYAMKAKVREESSNSIETIASSTTHEANSSYRKEAQAKDSGGVIRSGDIPRDLGNPAWREMTKDLRGVRKRDQMSVYG